MKVKELPSGTILWSGYRIIGIVGCTLDVVKYGERDVTRAGSNQYDWELLPEKK